MKIKRHGYFWGLVALLVICLAAGLTASAAVASAEEGIAENEIFTSGDFQYTVAEGNATIVKYAGSADVLVVPDQLDDHVVKKIDEGAFSPGSGLTSVTLPDGLTSIGDSAFSACSGLTSVTLPDTIMFIGEGAFSAGPNLTLTVSQGSYAAEYARENGIPYTFINE